MHLTIVVDKFSVNNLKSANVLVSDLNNNASIICRFGTKFFLFSSGVKETEVFLEKLKTDIIYWPDDFSNIPHINSLRNGIISIRENNLDFVFVLDSLDIDKGIKSQSFRNTALFKQNIAISLITTNCKYLKNGKILRLVSNSKKAKSSSISNFLIEGVKFDSDGYYLRNRFASFISDLNIFRPSERYVFFPSSTSKPVIFVFPIFLAVGGVERNTIEVMDQLKDKYNFVVITMEKLRVEQGSLAQQALKVASHVIELPEITESNKFLKILVNLNKTFLPNLIWVCNGSPWFCDNAMRIRKIFSKIPIIDQEVYDTNEGWINRYMEDGIQSFDRFIAINRKIEKKFKSDFRIPASRIDLIYPVINSEKILNVKSEKINKSRLLRKFKLPANKKIFLFIGRLTKQKQPQKFLEIALSRKVKLSEHYVVLGDGEFFDEVISFVDKNNMKNVTVIKYVENVPEFLTLISGLVITSLYEGLPIAMLEALSMGVPVFSTNVGDIAYVLDKYKGGDVYLGDNTNIKLFLNAYEAWINRLQKYSNHLKINDHRVIAEFSASVISSQYERSWKKAMRDYHDNF